METVGQLTLANFKRKFNDEQYEKFLALFEHLLFSTYITHLEKYSGEKVVVKQAEKVTDGRIDVKTDTVTDTRKIPVDFSFIRKDDRWQLYDVHIEGISLVKNYRSQFREILINRSPDAFLERLEKKVEENDKKK
jgi:phospholipid transport system substrate-binding protein